MENLKKKDLKDKEIIDPESQEGVEEDDQQAPIDQVDETDEIDYKAELAKTKEISNNYRQGMLKAKKELKEKKKDVDWDEELDEDSVEEEPKQVNSDLDQFKSDLLEDTIEDMLDTMTDNPDERALIKYHYENTLNKTGSSKRKISSDLANAKALANKNKIVKENNELKLAIKTRSSIKNSGAGNSAQKPHAKSVKLTEAEKVIFARMNDRRITRGDKAMTAEEFKSN